MKAKPGSALFHAARRQRPDLFDAAGNLLRAAPRALTVANATPATEQKKTPPALAGKAKGKRASKQRTRAGGTNAIDSAGLALRAGEELAGIAPARSPERLREALGEPAALGGNKLERAYFRQFLAPRLESGELALVHCEGLFFNLASALARIDLETGERLRALPSMIYKPDFQAAGERIEIHEVKGEYERDDSRVKFKAAAAAWPCFRWVWAKHDGKKWAREEWWKQ